MSLSISTPIIFLACNLFIGFHLLISIGYGIKYEGDPGSDVGVDYYFWGGAFNTFFWIDRDSGHFGVFATNHSPPQYNISDDIEQIVDEAKLYISQGLCWFVVEISF